MSGDVPKSRHHKIASEFHFEQTQIHMRQNLAWLNPNSIQLTMPIHMRQLFARIRHVFILSRIVMFFGDWSPSHVLDHPLQRLHLKHMPDNHSSPAALLTVPQFLVRATCGVFPFSPAFLCNFVRKSPQRI